MLAQVAYTGVHSVHRRDVGSKIHVHGGEAVASLFHQQMVVKAALPSLILIKSAFVKKQPQL